MNKKILRSNLTTAVMILLQTILIDATLGPI